MKHIVGIDKTVETRFLSLPQEEKTAVISHGVVIRLSQLNNRLFLARSKIRFFEEKYHIKLSELEAQGLPEDADFEMHEDYISWCHWNSVAEKVGKQLGALQGIAEYGVYK